MTQGGNSLHFFYDASNKPAIVDFNGTKYAYVHNLQGDIVAILDSNGSVVVQYKYDAWGRIINGESGELTLTFTLDQMKKHHWNVWMYPERLREDRCIPLPWME
jgi:YD repeat-containing protein